MKLEVMKKEEALLLELDKLKEDKLLKDEENDKLRQQLNEMKAKMEKVSSNFDAESDFKNTRGIRISAIQIPESFENRTFCVPEC